MGNYLDDSRPGGNVLGQADSVEFLVEDRRIVVDVLDEDDDCR